MKLFIHLVVGCAITLMGCEWSAAQQTNIPEDYQLVYQQSFEEKSALDDFEMSDPNAWRIGKDSNGTTYLELFQKSDYEARVRSPHNIALITTIKVSDFILEAELSQTGKEYGHRDLCIFFGMQNPTNFYYAHIASKADDHANNIFLVNDEPRIKIAEKTTTGTNWGHQGSWHKIRLERTVSDKKIKLFFDTMDQPIMVATDSHFFEGYIGFGSFDDTGRFSNIKIWAPQTHKSKIGFFR